MTPAQTRIITRLREGPLPARSPEAVGSASANCLKVQINHLRAMGFEITTVTEQGDPWKAGPHKGRRGSVRGSYVLKEPAK